MSWRAQGLRRIASDSWAIFAIHRTGAAIRRNCRDISADSLYLELAIAWHRFTDMLAAYIERQNLTEGITMNSHNIQGHLGHCREECERNLPECGEFHRRKQMLWGIVLISIGSAFLLNRLAFINLDTFVGLNTLSWLDWWHLLPLLLALSGLIDIFSARKLSHVGHGFFKVVVGAWLYICLEHIWGWTFSNSWPTILVALGVSIMTGGLQHSRRKSDKESPQ